MEHHLNLRLNPPLFVFISFTYLPIQSSRSQQSRIQSVRSIGSHDNFHLKKGREYWWAEFLTITGYCTWINLPALKHQIHPFDSATKKTRKVCPTSKQILLQNTSSSMARTSKRVEYKLQRTSISVLWISLSADVPSENRRPPVRWTILDSYNIGRLYLCLLEIPDTIFTTTHGLSVPSK